MAFAYNEDRATQRCDSSAPKAQSRMFITFEPAKQSSSNKRISTEKSADNANAAPTKPAAIITPPSISASFKLIIIGIVPSEKAETAPRSPKSILPS